MANDRRRSSRKGARCRRNIASAVEHQPPPSKTEKCKNYCRAFIAFLFSHIGIGALVVAYMVAGAFLFNSIEGQQEDHLNATVQALILSTVDNLWRITNDVNVLNKSKWRLLMKNATDQFSMDLMKQINDGYDDKPKGKKWEFPGAFLFCLTVITLIGEHRFC